MSAGDLIVILLIGLLIFLAVRTVRRKPASCSCGCQGCAYAGNCNKMKTEKR